MLINHLGVRVKVSEFNHINKDSYLSAKPEGMAGWKEEHYISQKKKAEINFEANMKYFDSLDKDLFEKYLLKQCQKHGFKECVDLNELSGVPGVYIIVLDEYKQLYIGISDDIKKRIMGHWSKKKSLERLIFGDMVNSILSIDSFGALDTTRVFYKRTYDQYKWERKFVDEFDGRYMLNRTGGGIGFGDPFGEPGVKLAVVAESRKRTLVPFIDIEAFKSILTDGNRKYYAERYPELFERIEVDKR